MNEVQRYFVLALLVALAGCAEPPTAPKVDQCMRRELFDKCMASLPKGPQSTVTNDWDEVVGRCDSIAYYQSLRPKNQIKAACKVGEY